MTEERIKDIEKRCEAEMSLMAAPVFRDRVEMLEEVKRLRDELESGQAMIDDETHKRCGFNSRLSEEQEVCND